MPKESYFGVPHALGTTNITEKLETAAATKSFSNAKEGFQIFIL
jgi:hypothetical protein